MAKKENPDLVPKKFRKLKKSFLENLQQNNSSFFMSFPKELTFHGKEKDENIILIVRSHWIIYLPYLAMSFVILLLPVLFQMIMSDMSNSTTFFLGLFLSSLTVSLTILIYAFVKWFYNVNIITDERVIEIDFTSVVSHSMTEARLEKIEDITHKQLGALGSIFDIGTVYIQTAGATAEIEFSSIPKPREVQEILYDLLESKEKRRNIMDINDLLNNLGGNSSIISFNILSLLKAPIILLLIGNILFSLLLFLRVRILADTFKTPQNKIVKTVILLYILIVLVGSLFSLLFVILT